MGESGGVVLEGAGDTKGHGEGNAIKLDCRWFLFKGSNYSDAGILFTEFSLGDFPFALLFMSRVTCVTTSCPICGICLGKREIDASVFTRRKTVEDG